MAVCKFFLQGNCKFGGNYSLRSTHNHGHLTENKDRCKNEHPGRNGDLHNPYAPLRSDLGSQGGSNALRGTMTRSIFLLNVAQKVISFALLNHHCILVIFARILSMSTLLLLSVIGLCEPTIETTI